jgi:hypothetical protein
MLHVHTVEAIYMKLVPIGTNDIVAVLFLVGVMVDVTYYSSYYFLYWASDKLYLRPKILFPKSNSQQLCSG